VSCTILILAVILAGCTQAATPVPSITPDTTVTFIDSGGTEITLPRPAERIIATNSDCAEMLIAIGAGDRIVGVSDTVIANPLLMKQLPSNVTNIGSWSTPNVEIMMSLKPDVIVCYAYANKPKNIDQIWAANLTIVSLDCYKLSTLTADARSLGAITGNGDKAKEYVGFLEKYLKLVKGRTAGLATEDKPTVYWESYTAFSTVGKSAAGDQMIALVGGANIAGDNTTTYPKVNAEWVIEKDPEFIIKTFSATEVNTTEGAARIVDEVTSRPGFGQIGAVKSGRVYVIPGNVASGARCVVGIVYLAKLLNPELYPDVDPEAVVKEYSETFLPGADEVIYIYPAPA
jgi:iron complex transport system substrate-binding protein